MDALKIVGAFALGAAAGATACFFAVRNAERLRADEEIAAIKEYYDERDRNREKKIADVKKQGEELKKTTEYIKDKINYQTFSAVDDVEDEKIVINDHPREVMDIYEITLEQYVNSELAYDKQDCRFYVEDGTLCDENGEPMDIDHSVGYDILKAFEDSLVDTIYVRNDKIETDYEIEKAEGGYLSLIGDI